MTPSVLRLNRQCHIFTLAMTSTLLALSLIGCGGSDSSSSTDSSHSGGNANNGSTNGNSGNSSGSNSGSTTPTTSGGFSQTAIWSVTDLADNAVSCFDFESQAAISCDNTAWDIKFENQARAPKLWSNSGDSGTGKGGVFGLMDWSDLKTYKNGTQDPITGRDITMHYNDDKSGGIFVEHPWFEYNLQGKHQLYPNNRVYMITSDSSSAATESSVLQPIYALQIINYYNDSGKSGQPTLRWIDTAIPNKVNTQTFDASNDSNWVYVNLATGKTVTDKKGVWHIGFKRNDVILNGGNSGNGKVAGFLAATPDGYYDAKGEPILSKFTTDNIKASAATLTNTSGYAKPSAASGWKVEQKGSDLSPSYIGTFPNLDFGWFTYNGMTHQLNAKPIDTTKGALVRSAEGNSYARVRLDKVNYATPTSKTATSWEFKIDIQPAAI